MDCDRSETTNLNIVWILFLLIDNDSSRVVLLVTSNSVLNKGHHLKALGNKVIQIIIFIPHRLEVMP